MDSYDKNSTKQPAWCGAFVASVYARCGIDVGKGFASNKKVPAQLSMMEGATAYQAGDHKAEAGGAVSKVRPNTSQKDINKADDQLRADPVQNATPEHKADGVDLATIEGNASNQVRSHVRQIKLDHGNLIGEIIGWGRPPELEDFPRPGDSKDAAMVKKIDEGPGGPVSTR